MRNPVNVLVSFKIQIVNIKKEKKNNRVVGGLVVKRFRGRSKV